MVKNDIWINKMCRQGTDGMIKPFENKLIRAVNIRKTKALTEQQKVLSYGLSSFGYDIRLSPKEFRVFRHIPGTVVDPKNFNPDNLEPVKLHNDENGSYFILPAHSYGLGVALERLEIPNNITVICIGKSSYARCGIIANLTPVEAGWKGHLTLEFSNSSSADCRIYANEGVAQLLFLEGEQCNISYETRQGKYQDQPEQITLSKV